MRAAARRAMALCVAVWLAATGSAFAAGTLPYRVALFPTWGEGAGSDAFRSDLGHALADALSHGCFAGVEVVDDDPAGANAELLLTVVLSNVLEELYFEDSIAGALQPGEPTKQLRRVARFEVTVQSVLETVAAHAPVAGKNLVTVISRRPLVIGEDPQVVARQLAVERIVSDLRKAYCRGGNKLLRKIQQALAKPPAEEQTPR